MKKLNLLFVILASFGLITMSSCNGDDPAPIVKDISISVSGGTEVTVEGANIAKDITVTATEKTTKDVVVNITSNAAEGEATIEPAQVTIKKGEISATSKITFASAKFPEGTAQKKITVTIASTTEGVKLGTPTTDFLVKGAGGPELTALTITANGTEFNTTTEAKELSVVFTLAEALTEKVAVTITVDPTSDDIFKTMFPTIPAIEIPANEKTLTIPFSMPKGTEGLLKINFAVTNPKVDLKTASLSATFVVDEDPAAPPTFSLARTTTGDIVVPATGDKVETFKVTLSKAAAEEQTITLTAAPEGGVLSAASVVFAIGETSKDVTITFQSSVFTSDLVTKDIVVTGASTVLTAKTASITYAVKGTKVEVPKQNLDIAIYGSPTYATFNTETSMTATCKFGVQKTEGYDHAAVEDFTITPVITGGVEGTDYKYPDGETAAFNIKKGDTWPEKKIIVLPAAKGKTIIFDFSNAPIKYMRETTFNIIVNAYQKPAQPVDYGITFNLEGHNGDLAAMEFDTWMKFEFKNYNTVPKGTPVYFTYKVTTDDGTDVTNMCELDMGSPLNIMARYSGYLQVSKGTDNANVAQLTGKKLTVTVMSEDAIIGNSTASFTMAN